MAAVARVRDFFGSEDGAVTTDWILLCGFAVGLSFAVLTSVGSSAVEYGGDIGDRMKSQGIASY